mgnify:CR=1 FL=1
MDAFAVSICKCLSVQKVRLPYVMKAGLWFGGFQALMPLIGYLAGVSFAELVGTVDHWIAFVLLGLIGANMIKESTQKEEEVCCCQVPDFSFRTMLGLAVATSIDALAVGVSFAFLHSLERRDVLFCEEAEAIYVNVTSEVEVEVTTSVVAFAIETLDSFVVSLVDVCQLDAVGTWVIAVYSFGE